MSIEVRPLGSTCNLRCDYCYEHKERDIQGTTRYQREAVLDVMQKVGGAFTVFGGEPLLLPLPQLEELLRLSCTKFGHSSVQTNGSLITDAHIDVFLRWKTGVGISIDGPGELNDIRWAGTLEATRAQTAKTEANIRKLCGLAKTHPSLLPSLIVTLHAGNVGEEKFPHFVSWLRELDALGIKQVNLHTMELDHLAAKWAMPMKTYASRFIDLWELQPSFQNITFRLFRDITTLLKGDIKHVTCHWKACDPWNSDAVRGIEHDGSPSFCGRVFKSGQRWLPAEGAGVPDVETQRSGFPAMRHYERDLALQATPQDVGGCKDCTYWSICHGNCPGTAEDGDWRRRTTFCEFYKLLFAYGETRIPRVHVPPTCASSKQTPHSDSITHGDCAHGDHNDCK